MWLNWIRSEKYVRNLFHLIIEVLVADWFYALVDSTVLSIVMSITVLYHYISTSGAVDNNIVMMNWWHSKYHIYIGFAVYVDLEQSNGIAYRVRNAQNKLGLVIS